jgi:hypothetical protein
MYIKGKWANKQTASNRIASFISATLLDKCQLPLLYSTRITRHRTFLNKPNSIHDMDMEVICLGGKREGLRTTITIWSWIRGMDVGQTRSWSFQMDCLLLYWYITRSLDFLRDSDYFICPDTCLSITTKRAIMPTYPHPFRNLHFWVRPSC